MKITSRQKFQFVNLKYLLLKALKLRDRKNFIRNFRNFLYPSREHSQKSPESNGKNCFWKFEVLTIENCMQKFLSPWTYIWISIVKTSNFQKQFLPFEASVSGEYSWPEHKNFQKFRNKFLRSLSSGRGLGLDWASAESSSPC